MTSDGLTRTERRTAATTRAIVDAAEAIMLEGGSTALTLEAVADRADVAVQTIYNRVGGRSALLIAVAERAFEENRQYMDAAYGTAGTPIQRILRAAEAYRRFAAERPHQFRLLADPPDETAALDRVADLVEEQNTNLVEALREGIDDGSIDPRIDPVATATTLWAAMNGVLGLAWRADRLRADQPQVDQHISALIAMLADGLFKTSR